MGFLEPHFSRLSPSLHAALQQPCGWDTATELASSAHRSSAFAQWLDTRTGFLHPDDVPFVFLEKTFKGKKSVWEVASFTEEGNSHFCFFLLSHGFPVEIARDCRDEVKLQHHDGCDSKGAKSSGRLLVS